MTLSEKPAHQIIIKFKVEFEARHERSRSRNTGKLRRVERTRGTYV